MKNYTILILAILGVQAPAMARYSASMDLDQMTTYADNAILNGAEHGYKKVTLRLGDANPALVEKLADDLRARGYRIDEEAMLVSPDIIKVIELKLPVVAQR